MKQSTSETIRSRYCTQSQRMDARTSMPLRVVLVAAVAFVVVACILPTPTLAARQAAAHTAAADDEADATPSQKSGERYKIEGTLVFDGKAFAYSVPDEAQVQGHQPVVSLDGGAGIPQPKAGWQSDVRVILNNGERVAYVRDDGSFVFEDILPGGYILQVQSPLYIFPALRVDVGAKTGRVKVRLAALVLGGAVPGVTLPYPIQLRPRGMPMYFQPRDGFKIRDVLMSPMGLMVGMTVLMMVVFPKLIGSLSPDELREMQQSNPLNMASQSQGLDIAGMLARATAPPPQAPQIAARRQ